MLWINVMKYISNLAFYNFKHLKTFFEWIAQQISVKCIYSLLEAANLFNP